jgi:hypothetical protein
MKKGVGMLMKRSGLALVIAIVLSFMLLGLSRAAPNLAQGGQTAAGSPVTFIENVGQIAEDAHLISLSTAGASYVTGGTGSSEFSTISNGFDSTHSLLTLSVVNFFLQPSATVEELRFSWTPVQQNACSWCDAVYFLMRAMGPSIALVIVQVRLSWSQ